MIKRLFIFLFIIFSCHFARGDDLLAEKYTPKNDISGTIRIWGHGAFGKRADFIETLVVAWENKFKTYYPNIKFENHLNGTAAAIGAICANVGDLALMGREIWPYEIAAFKEIYGYEPTSIDILTGSLATRNRDFAIVLYKNKSNPLPHLNLNQIYRIYSANPKTGESAITTWGQLGLTGEWANKPIYLHGWPIERGFSYYFEQVVFNGSHKWNPNLIEYPDTPGTKGGQGDGGQKSLDALANDPYGLAISSLCYSNDHVAPIAISRENNGPYLLPNRDSIIMHSYPLTRIITMVLNKEPTSRADPKLAEFIKFILSNEGQTIVEHKGGGYLPIIKQFAKQEVKKLNAHD